MYISVSVINLDIKEISVRKKKRNLSEFSFILIKRNFLLDLLLIWGVSSFFSFPLAGLSVSQLGLFLLLLHLLLLFLPILAVFTLLLFALLFLLVLCDSCCVSLFPRPVLFKTGCRENQKFMFAQSWSLYWLSLLLATSDQIRAACSGSDVFFWQIYIGCYSNSKKGQYNAKLIFYNRKQQAGHMKTDSK